ncbi:MULTISPECIES: endo-1,4-beta-xylanase [Spirulina sp. CCY15215]|uniref:endo-1,4-beta-xylanase n=1 Tax=Spirulina sp. CCY15215 TaxID=2767591 RepID=UPI0019503DA8|nr:endo-1,4-beta-xylanase [Spirulina major]
MPLKNYLPNFKFGTAVNHKILLDETSPLHTILPREFDFLVPEWEMKFYSIRHSPQDYDFAKADRLAEFARTHNLTLRGHCLCWHLSSASWLRKLTKLELENVLRDYIFTTVDRYKDVCTAWDVVNEAIADNGKIRKSIWSQIENFIPKCFQWAHEADRHAHLIYLDYRLHTPTRWKAIAQMVKEMKENSIPIHGVGLQVHNEVFRTLGIAKWRLPNLIRQLQSLGVAVHISEVSIPIYPPAQNLPLQAKYALQGKAYAKVLDVALTSGCKSFNLWGLSDCHAFYKPPEGDRNSTPCTFDRELQPKPAYFALETVLKRYCYSTVQLVQ